MVELTLERRIPKARQRVGAALAGAPLTGTLPGAAIGAWRALRSVLGLDPPNRVRQLVADAVLARILLDRGLLSREHAAAAAAERDRTGLLLEQVLHASYGVPLDSLLAAAAERRALLGASRH